MYRLPDPDSEGASFLWIRFKIMLPPQTRAKWGSKRSYWINWGPAFGRLARGGDAAALQAQQPELYEQILLELKMSFSKSWLIASEGQTDASINAEVGRLLARKQLRAAKAEARARNGQRL
jgi:hypothetical protein